MESSSFTPDVCASLHNQLMARMASHSLTASLEQNFVEQLTRKLPQFALIPNIKNTPIYHFLSLIKTFTAGSNLSLVTPFALQPDPDFFLLGPNSIFAHVTTNGHPTVIRLSRPLGYICPLPPKNEWPSLERILQAWNDEWESGKFYWDSGAKMRSWTERDLKRSLDEWESLLESIERKRPGHGSDTKKTNGLDPILLTRFAMSSFAFEFLSKARIPDFKYIAPGIAAFTPETFLQVYSSEDPDSRRLAWTSEADPDEYPCFLFPSDVTVPRPAADPKFDKEWGFGKFTVSRRAGLSIDTEGIYGDGVQFVDPAGRTSAFKFAQNPFGPSRSPRLEEVLKRCTRLVQDGIWDVAEEGVSNGAQWYEDQAMPSRSE